jgi:hypothetical protein
VVVHRDAVPLGCAPTAGGSNRDGTACAAASRVTCRRSSARRRPRA